jgi:hypothetical protein
LLVLGQEVAVKAVRAKTFVKVRLFGGLSDVFETKQPGRVDHLLSHLLIRQLLDIRLGVHMIRPFVNLLEVLCNYLLNLLAILEDLRVLPFNLPFDSGNDWRLLLIMRTLFAI